jgi:hypothetical protein
MISLQRLLAERGFDHGAKAKITRHETQELDVRVLLAEGYFEEYQSFQSRPVFEIDYVISCIGHGPGLARFVGVYRKLERLPKGSRRRSRGFPYPRMRVSHCYFYKLVRESAYEDLERRIVVRWKGQERAWCQVFRDNEVLEVLPSGFIRPFPGYYDFVLTFAELQGILASPEAHPDWHRMLSAVGGIYLLTDSHTGQQYVGSAYGYGGILQRWRAYVRDGDAGNKRLKELLRRRPSAFKGFMFTVLRTLDRTLSRQEVLRLEALFKDKLGSRAIGLNAN